MHKKSVFNIERFSILFDLLTSKKIAPSLVRVEKNSLKLGTKGIKRSGILR
jgi:hypothetical protein